jgi:diguanylate cyclase (GGDEF)-like protein
MVFPRRRDVTQLEKGTNMHVSAVDSAPCAVIETDAGAIVVDANSVFVEWTGKSLSEIVGHPLSNFVEWEPESTPPVKRNLPSLAFVSGPDAWVRPVLVESADGNRGNRFFALFDATAQREFTNELQGQQALTQRTQKRLELVIAASIAFDGANTEEELSAVLVDTTAQAFAAEDAVVYLSDENSGFRYAAGVNPFVALDDLDSLQTAARALSNVLKISGLEEAQTLSPAVGRAFEESGVQSMIIAPLHQGNTRLGLLGVFFHHPRQFDEQASPLADALASQAGRAIANLQLREQLHHAATHDNVTGLPNRRLLEEHLEQRVKAEHDFVAIVFIDMDGFKQVNDQLGHHTGDRLLSEVGRRLQASVREEDLVARYGGDEFVVVCEVSSEAAAAEVAERIREIIAGRYATVPDELQPTASIGLTVSPADMVAARADQLLRAADQAMYRAKLAGGDRVILDPVG